MFGGTIWLGTLWLIVKRYDYNLASSIGSVTFHRTKHRFDYITQSFLKRCLNIMHQLSINILQIEVHYWGNIQTHIKSIVAYSRSLLILHCIFI